MPLATQAAALEFPSNSSLAASHVETRASAQVPIGPFAGGTIKTTSVKGALRSEAWKISQSGLSTLQILEPLRQQLVDDGYDILLDCKDADCGGFDFRYEISLLPEPEMHVDLGDFRFLTASRLAAKDDTPEYLSLMVSRSASAGFVQVTYVGKSQVPEGAVVASTKSTDTITTIVAPTIFAPTPAPTNLAGLLETFGRAPLEDLTFKTGSASLGTNRFQSLAALSEYLKANPDKTVALVGHTDSAGSLRGNIALSRKRASSVVEHLVSVYGIPRKQMEADGVGYLSPRASNLTPDGRTENRRVEVILTSTQN